MKLESRQLVPDQSQLALVRDGKEAPLAIGQDASLSARGELDGSLEAPMVFVGYGLSIPEAGWDDFAGLDLNGKIAVYVNAFPPVKVSDNVKSHVNTADERWLALKRAGRDRRRDDRRAAARIGHAESDALTSGHSAGGCGETHRPLRAGEPRALEPREPAPAQAADARAARRRS